MNGIEKIEPFGLGNVTKQDIICAILSDLGVSISSRPRNYKSKAYSSDWELFDPEKVEEPDELPEYWRRIYDLHNSPQWRDCRELKFRYVHVPVNILPGYPRIYCKGIFCLEDSEIKADEIKAEYLTYIGNELE